MTTIKRREVEHLITNFLNKQPNPKTPDWKQLIELFPQHAIAIADAAIVRAAGDAADGSDEPYELDVELANRTLSKALSKVHQAHSSNLELAKKKVACIQKPATRRQMAIEVGIGPYPSLINGILSGRIKGPSKVLEALAARLDVPRVSLIEFFRQCFEGSAVPAFKGGDSKPKVAIKPVPWKEAVRGLELSEEETIRLIKLGEEE